MKLKVRRETEQDFTEVEQVTYKAFHKALLDGKFPWQEVCDEHLVVHKLRKSNAYIPELSFVVEGDGNILGHIMLTKARVVGDVTHEVLILGPVSVLPEFQKLGIGSMLIEYAVLDAIRMNFSGIALFGYPEYYPRFGFTNAAKFGITTANGENPDALMAMELKEGSLQGVKGKLFYDPAFDVCRQELEAFNQAFLNELERY